MANETGRNDVIVADNDYIIRDILRCLLEGNGFAALLAVDGLEAIEYATRTHASLVILDYRMPKLDGFRACAEIRRLPEYAGVPIMILTAFDDEATRKAAAKAGATSFLTKPFKAADLLHSIGSLTGAPSYGTAIPASGAQVWRRRNEPRPLFGEPSELSEGRRVLNLCRR